MRLPGLPALPTTRMPRWRPARKPRVKGYRHRHVGGKRAIRGFRAHHVRRIGRALVLHHPSAGGQTHPHFRLTHRRTVHHRHRHLLHRHRLHQRHLLHRRADFHKRRHHHLLHRHRLHRHRIAHRRHRRPRP